MDERDDGLAGVARGGEDRDATGVGRDVGRNGYDDTWRGASGEIVEPFSATTDRDDREAAGRGLLSARRADARACAGDHHDRGHAAAICRDAHVSAAC
jgi:hypothetical protein